MIKLENVTKIYEAKSKTEALAGVNLTFGKRGLVCVLGASGCGKTTLLNLIGGLDNPTSGTVTFNGNEISTLNGKQLYDYRNKEVGFVFQSGNLLPYLTVFQNVRLSLEFAGIKDESKVEGALKKVGLWENRNDLPSELSGGQYQRVAIARAIVGNPGVILADEPTGSLDEETSESVMRLLKELSEARLVIIVTHNSALAQKYSDRIIRLASGRVVSDTAPIELAVERSRIAETSGKVGKSFVLSLRRMRRSIAQTVAVSIACAVGVLALCIVLASTSAFSAYIKGIEGGLLSTFGITVGEGDYDVTSFFEQGGRLDVDKLDDEVYVKSTLTDAYFRTAEGNNLTEEYVSYVEKLDESLYNYIRRDYGLDYDSHIFMEGKIGSVTLNVSFAYVLDMVAQTGVASTVLSLVNYFNQLPSSRDLVESGYSLVYGDYPSKASDLVLVLDEDGCVDDYAMAILGYYSLDEAISYLNGGEVKRLWSYKELASKKFTFFNNDVVYTENSTGFFTENKAFSQSVRPMEITNPSDGMELNICGILKSNGGAFDGLRSGLYYTSELDKYFLDQAPSSAIVERMNDTVGRKTNPLNGVSMVDTLWEELYSSFGGKAVPRGLEIFASSVDNKQKIMDYLEKWNENNEDVIYIDNVSALTAYVNEFTDNVTLLMLLIACGAILVSAITLGVISFISVKARMQEIGVLRCLGAGKLDVMVNVLAEPSVCGFLGGVLGIGFAYLALAIVSLFLPIISAGSLNGLFAMLALVGNVVVSGLSGVISAVKAVRISPAIATKA